jgi:hypothetical protein
MNIISKIIVVTALSLSLSGTARAAEQTIKPLQGISFHAGTKHAVSYFLQERHVCKLTVTVADDAAFAPARYERAIKPGRSTTYPFAEGKAIEFHCLAEANAMHVKLLEMSATN